MNKNFSEINTFLLTIVLNYKSSLISYHFSLFIELVYENLFGSIDVIFLDGLGTKSHISFL